MKLSKKSTIASLVVSATLLMTGCAAAASPKSSPTATPTPSVTAHSVAEPSDYSTGPASPKPTPKTTPKALQASDDILEITDGIRKVTLTFSGSATVMELNGPQIKKLPFDLEYKAKQAILDSRLSTSPKLSDLDMKCTADDLAIKVSIDKNSPTYRPCEYPSNNSDDPLFVAAHDVLKEVY